MKDLLSQLNATIITWEKLNEFPTEITYFILLTILLITLSIVIMAVLYSRRWHLVIREKRQKDLRFRYQYFIYDALVESNKDEVLSTTTLIVNKFKKSELKNSEQKQLMIDLIIELKKSFSGDAKKQFQQLYICLGLYHESIAKLNSNNKLEQIKGIRELSEIGYDCPELDHAFVAWQNSPYTLLADEVKLAAIRMESKHMLSFLPQQKDNLSDWLQIQLSHQLQSLPAHAVPSFSQWLHVQEPSAIIFVLRMIALFKQEEDTDLILPILLHAHDEVVIEAVKTLEALDARQHISSIFNLLDTEDPIVKITVIHAIGTLGHVFHANLLKPFLNKGASQISVAAKQAIDTIQAKTTQSAQKPYQHYIS